MHNILHTAIEENLSQALQFVLRFMPIELDNDQIYEGLLGNPLTAQAFAAAAQFLPSSNLNRRVTLMTEDYGVLTLNVRLGPTDKYSSFLLPKDLPTLSRHSALSQALALPYRVARDWQMLKFTFALVMNDVDDVSTVAFMFPWIRPIIAQWDEEHPAAELRPRQKVPRIRGLINKEVKAILSEKTPRIFPRLTEELNAVCRSGKTLFSQYRMLEATHAGGTLSPVVIEAPTNSVPDWLVTHLNEVLGDWKEELAGIAR